MERKEKLHNIYIILKYEAVNNKLQMHIEVQSPKLCSDCLYFHWVPLPLHDLLVSLSVFDNTKVMLINVKPIMLKITNEQWTYDVYYNIATQVPFRLSSFHQVLLPIHLVLSPFLEINIMVTWNGLKFIWLKKYKAMSNKLEMHISK